MTRRITLAVAALACSGCASLLPGGPSCVQAPAVAESDEPGFFILAAVPPGEERLVHVVVRATGDLPVQLLLNEWSLAMPSGTSAVGFGSRPPLDIATASYPIITLPPGGEWQEHVFPRSAVVAPFLPLRSLIRLRPLLANHPCPYECTLRLAYSVVVGRARHLGVLDLPVSMHPGPDQAPRLAATGTRQTGS